MAAATALLIGTLLAGAAISGGAAIAKHQDDNQQREDQLKAAQEAKNAQAVVDQKLSTDQTAIQTTATRDMQYLAARRNSKRLASVGSQAPGALPMGTQPGAGKTALGS